MNAEQLKKDLKKALKKLEVKKEDRNDIENTSVLLYMGKKQMASNYALLSVGTNDGRQWIDKLDELKSELETIFKTFNIEAVPTEDPTQWKLNY